MSRAKRRSRPTHLDDALRPYVRRLARRQPSIHPDIWTRWADIVGADIARRSGPISLRRGLLVIAVGSSAWLQELSFWRNRLLDRFTEEVGPNVVTDLRFVFDPVWCRPVVENEPGRSELLRREPSPLPIEISRATAIVTDPELREVLERAVRATLERGR